MERVAELQQRLLGAGGQQHLNEIAELFELCESADLRVVVAALSAISQVLAAHRVAASDALQKWLRQHGAALRGLLNQLGSSGEAKAQIAALRLTVKILQEEAREMHKTPAPEESARVWGCLSPDQRLQELISAILLSPRWHSQVADCIMSEYVRRYADLRHFLMGHLRSCAEQMGKLQLPQKPEVEGKRRRLHGPFAEAAYQQGRSHEELFERMLALLKEAPEPPGKEDEELQDVLLDTAKPVSFYCKAYKHIFQEAWLKLLGLRVPLAHCAGLLQLLPSQVIPHLGRPLLVSDFYLRAFNAGSLELSVQALSGLLLLLTRYGLGDPETLSSSCGDFYAQLYSLLRPATFRLKKRARFQRLVAAALTSNLLPATSAAAFAKKCLRCAVLLSEPGTVMWLLSVAYGLIQRNHSRCSFLLHRAGDAVAKDPFDSEASLPEATAQVAQTSLWEIQLLFQHHLPAVQTLAKLFERPFFKPTSRKLDPELFLDQTMVKSYQQALKSAERQLSKLKARGAKPPLAFQSQEDEVARRVAGWAAALSTGQRRVGADL